MNKNIFYYVMIGMIAACAARLGFFNVPAAHAADLTVTPAVIDASGTPNDIMNYTLSVTNTTGNQLNVFASVYELTASGTQTFADPAGSDRPDLLADWIDVSRAAMMFAPGETKTIPVTITINPYAVAGDYHAVIGFVEGGTRVDAETHLDGAPQTLVDVAVASDLTASLKVDSFSAEKGFYSAFPLTFHYIIENDGDVASVPTGEIRFYDRLGHEISSVDANPDAISIAPGAQQSFTAEWQNGGGFGQYKALLDISYGPGDDTLENTAIVWVLPWQKLLIIFGTLFIVMIVLALWMHREYEKRHLRRRQVIEQLLKKRKLEPTIDLRHPNE